MLSIKKQRISGGGTARRKFLSICWWASRTSSPLTRAQEGQLFGWADQKKTPLLGSSHSHPPKAQTQGKLIRPLNYHNGFLMTIYNSHEFTGTTHVRFAYIIYFLIDIIAHIVRPRSWLGSWFQRERRGCKKTKEAVAKSVFLYFFF